MGSGFSQLFRCFKLAGKSHPELIFAASESLDQTLGQSFCYVRSSARFLSPTHSHRFLSPSHVSASNSRLTAAPPETAFKAISGASVSANTSTSRTLSLTDTVYYDATDGGVKSSIVNGFESTSLFSAFPLQLVPRGRGGEHSGPMDRAFFTSGPIERGALSGPLAGTSGIDSSSVPFSAPLGGNSAKNKKGRGIQRIGKSLYRTFSERKRSWIVPVRNLVGLKEVTAGGDGAESEIRNESNVQWALGKAGEDRVHVVISEELGWLFVGIYDGFNGPDAPEFLIGNLYTAVYNELEGIFWDSEGRGANVASENEDDVNLSNQLAEKDCGQMDNNCKEDPEGSVKKKVTFQSEQTENRRQRLWELLAEDDTEDGFDLSGSDRFAFSVDEAINVSNSSNRRSLSLLPSKLKHGLIKHRETSRSFLTWKYWSEAKKEKTEIENKADDKNCVSEMKRKVGPIDHESVLKAISRALEATELAFLDMTDKFLDQNPELALMGSCLLVVLMRDEDVYVMNVGDSRAIVAQNESHEEVRTKEESFAEEDNIVVDLAPARLTVLQLSTDHSMSIEEEVIRIKNEHPDDSKCIVNDRVKGRLKVTRAFGAGFLKQPKWNDALLEMFRNEYIGSAPYISCLPSLHHHRLLFPRDQFLVLSSDGLYQYLSNQEVVSLVESFLEKFPDGDPAQHLIEELLLRAAKKAGMDFHELLDIPQGDRRKYHDDVTVMVVSLEGRIWKSSGKYL